MVNKKNFIINFCFYSIIIFLIILCFKYIIPFLTPFILAFILVTLLRKPILWLNKSFKLSYKFSSVVILIFFYLTVGLLITLLSLYGVYGIQLFLDELPDLYVTYAEKVIISIVQYVKDIVILVSNNKDLVSMIDSGTEQLISNIVEIIYSLSGSLFSWLSDIVVSVPDAFIKTFLTIISSFFIAVDYDAILKFFHRQLGSKVSSIILEIKNYLFGTVFICIKSYIIIMSITFIELFIGLSILKVDNALIVSLLISILDILPVLGTGGVLIPWSIISFILGDIVSGIGLLLIYIVITVIRNIIEPKIVGTQLGLHPLITLMSMFLGVNVAGIAGLFGFPILLSLLLYLNNKNIIQLFK